MRAARWLPFGVLLALGNCTRSLDGERCPCASGYVCCVALNVCYPNGQACGEDRPQSGGGTSIHAGTADDDVGGAGLGRGGRGGTGGEGPGGVQDGAAAGEATAGAAGSPEPVAPTKLRFALVATQHNDNARTGANLDEVELTATNVGLGSFGELSRRPVRGAVFAQPLVAPAVTLTDGATKAVLYVATMANVVYALEAESPDQRALWSRSLGPPIGLPDPAIGAQNGEIWHEVGILGTPVLAPESGVLYVVAASKSGREYEHRVYALALATGEVLASAPCEQAGFDSAMHAQRAALTLVSDVLYVPFGGYESDANASGWVFRFARDLTPLGAVALEQASAGGVTMGGQGAAVDDDGALLLTTNRATVTSAPFDLLASRLLQLPGSGAQPSDVLVPSFSTEGGSNELGRSGPLLIPHSDTVVVAGQHRLFVVQRSVTASASAGTGDVEIDVRLRQELRVSGSSVCSSDDEPCDAPLSAPVYWPGVGAEPQARLFVSSPSDGLRAFGIDPARARLECDATAPACRALYASSPGEALDAEGNASASPAQLSISSNGREPGSALVWAAQAFTSHALRSPDGILRAFDAEDLTLRWSTQRAETPLGPLASGATPTISGGRVFIGTSDGVSGKQIFWDDETDAAPAISAFGDEALVLAWRTTAPQESGFQLKWSTDGLHFTQSSRFPASSAPSEPALASDGAHLYLAWTASSGLVQVASSDHPSLVQLEFMKQRSPGANLAALDYRATSAPALAYGHERLLLAFHRDREIVVLSSRDGQAFDTSTEVIIPVSSSSGHPPALAYLGDRLYLISTNELRQMSLFVSDDGGAHFTGPTPLSMSSVGHPALMAVTVQGSSAPDLLLAWADVTSDDRTWGRIKVATALDGNVERFARPHALKSDDANFSIGSALFRGNWYIAWLGNVQAPQPNVARYTAGELVTYGIRKSR